MSIFSIGVSELNAEQIGWFKAGSALNLTRWVSARAIKETFDPPRHFGYPFLGADR